MKEMEMEEKKEWQGKEAEEDRKGKRTWQLSWVAEQGTKP